ncbi:carbohydrate ABC transporter permease [Caldicellulosiruptoraceae bacterium PP1]
MFKRRVSLESRQAIAGRLFVYPWVIGFLLFFAKPFVQSFLYTFKEIDFQQAGGYTEKFIGKENYIEALTNDSTLIDYLARTIPSIIIDVPLIIMFSLFIAVLLNQKFFGRSIVRGAFFLPVVVTSGVLIYVIRTNSIDQFARHAGSAMAMQNPFLNNLDFKAILMQLTSNVAFLQPLIDAMDRIYEIIWKSGVQILIFLAGLQSIPSYLYECADVEGATKWESFWKITVPMLSPIIMVNIIYTIIDSFTDYSNDVLRYILTLAFTNIRLTYSATVAWIYFAIIVVILGIVAAIASRRVFYINE